MERVKKWKNPEEQKKAAIRKAMNLLLYRDRSEEELRGRLEKEDFDEDCVREAMDYVRSFGYLNDRRFASSYVLSASSSSSKAAMRRFLRAKGIREEWIEEALEEVPDDATDVMLSLLVRRAGEPHEMDEREKRRVCGYLSRRGFSGEEIFSAIRKYQNMA